MKKNILMILVAWVAVTAGAQNSLSPVMRGKLKATTSNNAIPAFVTVDDAARLQLEGVRVTSRMGDIVTVEATPQALQRIAAMPGVKSVNAPTRLKLHCDSSRNYTNVSQVLAGINLPQGFDGTGVVVGMVDSGIEFQHPAFKDADGKSRISRVYDPVGSGGNIVVIDGEQLPGSDYTTPEQIALLTTDDKAGSHGCHTTGIAAGTLVGKYGGMAPGAELVLAGIPSAYLDDYHVSMAARYIAHYAHSVGKPCVINMSLGNHDGPHDGNGILARCIDQLSEQYGVVFVLSAGNEAGTSLYLHKKFTETDLSLKSVMAVSSSNRANIDAWSRNDSPLSINYSIYSSNTGSIVYSGSAIACDTVLDISSDPEFSKYATGSINITQGIDNSCNKYRINATHNVRTNYGLYLAFSINGAPGAEVDVWDVETNAAFNSAGLAGYSDGSDTFSISDMATGKHSISVGACAARPNYPVVDKLNSTGYAVGAMGRFSSYGTDNNGDVHPFIVAPGVQVVSSVSRYNCNKSTYSQCLSYDGNKEYWYVKSGTSMSAPCVTGVVALWLQACPELGADQIKEVMAATAIPGKAGNLQVGANGMIDAHAGLEYIINQMDRPRGDVNGDGKVDVIDVNVLVNILLGNDSASRYYGRARVAGNNTIDIADVNAVLNIILTD